MRIIVTIKLNSRHREGVEENDSGGLIVYSKAPAVEGKANESLIKILAKHFRVPKSRVRLVRGHKGRSKTVDILL